jgi:mRNA-degrading endonuclease YafQ of YafQ-DinJ toxin-antitoxin module
VPNPKWDFKTSKAFRKSFNKLAPEQQKKARRAFKNEFKPDPSSRSHKINRLTAILGEVVRGFHVDQDLIVTWVVRGNQIVALDIGTHDVYK